jgi:hypothetical protein
MGNIGRRNRGKKGRQTKGKEKDPSVYYQGLGLEYRAAADGMVMGSIGLYGSPCKAQAYTRRWMPGNVQYITMWWRRYGKRYGCLLA